MALNYNNLWKVLIDKKMNKGDLCKKVGISASTVAKMSKGEPVALTVLERIGIELECDIGDLVSITTENEDIEDAEEKK